MRFRTGCKYISLMALQGAAWVMIYLSWVIARWIYARGDLGTTQRHGYVVIFGPERETRVVAPVGN